MKSFLKSIDYFSHKFTYTYKGKDKYNTVLGGMATFLALLIILLNGWLIGKDIYLRENPVVVGYDQAFPYYPTSKINYDNIFFGFFISDTLNNPFDDESILKIIPLIYTNYYDNNGNLKYKERFLELTDCTSEFKRLNLTAPLTKSILQPIKCIKNFNEILSGFWTDTYVSYLMFKAYRCSNETIIENSNLETEEDQVEFKKFEKNLSKINLISLNNKDDENDEFIKRLNNMIKNENKTIKKENKFVSCKSNEEIKKIIPTLFFNFFYTSVVINSKNYTDPMITQISEDWFILGTEIFKTIDYYFQNFIVRTDDGLIFSQNYKDMDKIGYYRHLADYRSLDNSDANIFWLNIYISNQVKYLTREYIKVQSIFAYLGGIIQVILIFFKLVFYPYFHKKLNLKIINELFDFENALLNGITDTKVLKRSNIRRIDSLIGSKLDKSKDKNMMNSNSKNNSYLLKINNSNKKVNHTNIDNGKLANNFPSSYNYNYLDKSKVDFIAITKKINERRISEITPVSESNIDSNCISNIRNNSKKINYNADNKYVSVFKDENFRMNLNTNNYRSSNFASDDFTNIDNNKNDKINNFTVDIDKLNFEDNSRKSNDLSNRFYPLSSKSFDLNFKKNSKNVNLNSKKSNKLDLKENSIKYHFQNKYENAFNNAQNYISSHESINNTKRHSKINVCAKNDNQNKSELLSINYARRKSLYEDFSSVKDDAKSIELSNNCNNHHTNIPKTSNKHKKKRVKISYKSSENNLRENEFKNPCNQNYLGTHHGDEISNIKSDINNFTENSNDNIEKNSINKNSNKRKHSNNQREYSKDRIVNAKAPVLLNLKDNHKLNNIQNNDNSNDNFIYNLKGDQNIQMKENDYEKNKYSSIVKSNFFKKSLISEDNQCLDKNIINEISDSKNHMAVYNMNSNLNLFQKRDYNIFNEDKNQYNENDFFPNNNNIQNINNNLFYIKPDNNSNNFNKKRRYKLRQELEGTEFERKLDEALNIKGRKLNLRNSEIFNSFYFYFCCRSRNFKQKNMLYKYAYENLNQFTDYLESIKNFQDMIKIKYLLFSTEQILSFPYLSNPKRMKVGIHHEIQEYARAFESRVCKKETAIEIFNYFHKNIRNETLNGIDKKIWNIFDPKMKNLFISTSNCLASSNNTYKNN